MQNNCISTENFEETCTIYSASKPVEPFMGADTDDAIDNLFDTLLQRFQQAIETSIEGGIEFTHESVALLYYYFHRIDMRRAESYIAFPDWLRNKGATINPKKQKDNKCFQYAITIALNYNKFLKKYLKKIEKIKRSDIDFSSYQRDWKEFEQNNTSIALNVLFVSHNSEEIKFAYKSRYNNERKNHVILLMINDEAKNCYYFCVKNLLELYSSQWLKSKKEAIFNKDNTFLNALDDTLNYQDIKTHLQRISQIKPYISKYNWEGIEFPAGPKAWETFDSCS